MANVIANIFIVPNINGKVTSTDLSLAHWNRRLELWGLPQFQPGDIPIQVWVASEEEDNWVDHGCPDYIADEIAPERTKRIHFPAYLPSYLLAGYEEGEIIKLDIKGGVLKLKAAQKEFRYSRFGRFEEVFHRVYRNS